ncbi:single-stranded DNA-dependent ATPase [Fragilaria crotonensis]|nr:single-stranded DNA-dependent ATPase [Fragilaria crotonensis]
MKRKKLQEKCREYGLSDQGTDQQLKARHQEYVNLYNAECDSLYPRSAEELVKLIHDREMAIRAEEQKARLSGAADHSLHIQRIKNARKAVGEGASVVVASGNSSFDSKFTQGFKELCASLKKRKLEESATSEENKDHRSTKDPGTPEQISDSSIPESASSKAKLPASQDFVSKTEDLSANSLSVNKEALKTQSEVKSPEEPVIGSDSGSRQGSVITKSSTHRNASQVRSVTTAPELPVIPPPKGFRSTK